MYQGLDQGYRWCVASGPSSVPCILTCTSNTVSSAAQPNLSNGVHHLRRLGREPGPYQKRKGKKVVDQTGMKSLKPPILP